uniref:tRNA pseudouridine synthase n=1 Tax=Anopheles maculatus TaxID=74869 RepID=A0A182SLL0_9DIPT
MGARLIVTTLNQPVGPGQPQPEQGVTYAGRLTREDGRIDWSRDAAALDRQIRALTPWPGTFTTLDTPLGGQVVKIGGAALVSAPRSAPPGTILDDALTVACGQGALRITHIQRPGRGMMDAGSFLRGQPRQITGLSVQQVLEEAAGRLAAGRPVTSITAGRTDAGVHATGQVAHLDFPMGTGLTGSKVRDALNFHMKPHPVAILQAMPVDSAWNARFSANRRFYRYRIVNRRGRLALDDGRVWLVKRALDIDAMNEAARHLLGRHDFTSFRASACQAKSPLRTLDRLAVMRHGEEITIETDARSFLHHQVRNM